MVLVSFSHLPTHFVLVVAELLSCVRLCATLRTVAHQAPLSMGYPRQEYWGGLPVPLAEDRPNPGIFPIQGSDLQLLDGRYSFPF